MRSEEQWPDYRDEFGGVGPLPASDGQRGVPEAGFFTGPEVGEKLPGFQLPSAAGPVIDLHGHRGGAKAAVVFYRSAVW